MKKFAYLLLLILCYASCKEDDENPIAPQSTAFNTSFTIETSDTLATVVQDDTLYFPYGLQSTTATFRPDSLLIEIFSGLSERFGSDDTLHNALFLSYFAQFNKAVLNNDSLSEQQFRGIFQNGAREIATNGRLYKGVGITWYDDEGVRWVSGKNIFSLHDFPSIPIDRNNSSFEIIESSVFSPALWPQAWTQKIKIKANCMLYNENNDTLRLKNLEVEQLVGFRNV